MLQHTEQDYRSKPPDRERLLAIPAIAELAERRQWVAWTYEEREGRPTKVPKNPRSGGNAASTNPSTWSSLDEALTAAGRYGFAGIGFVLTAADPYTGIDLDHCVDATSGEIAAWARALLLLCNAFACITPSGEGIRIFVRGTVPAAARKKVGHAEIYTTARFLTITDTLVPDAPPTIADCSDRMDAIHAAIVAFGSQTAAPPARQDNTTPGDPAASAAVPDDDLIVKACEASADFCKLLAGDWSAYSSQSSADLAFCGRAAWWTNGDPVRIGAWMRRSGLMRAKWDEVHYANGETYGQHTIDTAIASCTGGYSGRAAPTPIRPDIALAPPVDAAGVRAYIAQLEQEITTFAEQLAARDRTIAELEDRLSLIFAVKRNKQIRTESDTAIALVHYAAGETRGGRTYLDGYVRAPDTRIAEAIGCARQTAGKHKDRLKAWGLFDERAAWISETDAPDGRHVPAHTEQVVKLRQSPNETLRLLAALDPEKEKRHDGLRVKGCSQHPNAPIRHSWQDECVICDERIDEGFSVSRPAGRRVVAQDVTPPPDPTETVDTRSSVSQAVPPPGKADGPAGVGVQLGAKRRACGGEVPDGCAHPRGLGAGGPGARRARGR